MKKLLIFLAFLLLISTSAWGTIYTVAKTGADAASCVTDPPTTDCLTIQYAINGINLEPGDILYVRAGTYTEHIDTESDDAGDVTGNVTLMGYPGETAIIDADDSSAQVVRIDVQYFTIKDITIRNSSGYTGATVHTGLRLRASNTTVVNVTVLDGFDSYGINMDKDIAAMSNVEIENSTVVGSPLVTDDGAAIGMFLGTTNTHTNISVHGCPVTGPGVISQGYGIRAQVASGGSITGLNVYNNTVTLFDRGGIDIGGAITGCLVYNNQSTINGANGIHIGGSAGGDTVCSVYDNTVVYNGIDFTQDGSGILLDGYSDGSDAFRNYIIGSGESGIKASSDNNHDIYNNIVIDSAERGVWVRKSDPFTCTGDLIANNTVLHDGDGPCISFENTCTGSLTNNICIDSGSAATGIYIHSGATVTETYNRAYGFDVNFADEGGAISPGTGSLATNPNLNSNYRPKFGSDVIDAGAELPFMSNETQRRCGNGPDIGRYDYCTSGIGPMKIILSGISAKTWTYSGDQLFYGADPVTYGSEKVYY